MIFTDPVLAGMGVVYIGIRKVLQVGLALVYHSIGTRQVASDWIVVVVASSDQAKDIPLVQRQRRPRVLSTHEFFHPLRREELDVVIAQAGQEAQQTRRGGILGPPVRRRHGHEPGYVFRCAEQVVLDRKARDQSAHGMTHERNLFQVQSRRFFSIQQAVTLWTGDLLDLQRQERGVVGNPCQVLHLDRIIAEGQLLCQ